MNPEEVFQLDPDDSFFELCGKIFSTMKGLYVFKCALCEQNFRKGDEFLLHFSQAHNLNDCKPNVDLLSIDRKEREGCKEPERKYTKTKTLNTLDDLIMDNQQHSFETELRTDPLEVSSDTGNILKIEPATNYKKVNTFHTNCNEHYENQNDHKLLVNANTSPNDNKQLISQTETCAESLFYSFSDVEESVKLNFDNDQNSNDSALPKQERKVRKKVGRRKSRAHKNTELNLEEKPSNLKKMDLNRTQAKCMQCTAIFTDVLEFHEHMKEHISHICRICCKGFLTKQKLDLHNSNAKNCIENKRPFKCPLCNFAFRHKSSLTGHMNHHIVEKRFECKHCSKKYESSSRLRVHTRSHTNERPYKCHICGVAMANISNMSNHIIRHSEDNKKFQCEECPRSFFMRTELKMHVRAVHTEERPYLCSDCGISFATQGRLTAHKKKHHSVRERIFKCDICSKAFFDKSILQGHMITHGEDRKHACSTCGAAFKQRKTLMNHLKIHENKREYKCKFCEKAFNQSPALRSHIKSIHNNNS